MTEPRDISLRSFVRHAWFVLALQLALAAAAVLVTVWATFRVRPLIAEREQLIRSNKILRAAEAQKREVVATLEKRAATLRQELQGARDATPVLTEAIRAFHQKDYPRALAKYDEALRLNPGDPYIYNLKSYSEFKTRDFSGAARTLSQGLRLDPTYDWGYFDLARYQCAAGSPEAALGTITRAAETRGEPIRSGISYFLSRDGEFRRLCAAIVPELQELLLPAGD